MACQRAMQSGQLGMAREVAARMDERARNVLSVMSLHALCHVTNVPGLQVALNAHKLESALEDIARLFRRGICRNASTRAATNSSGNRHRVAQQGSQIVVAGPCARPGSQPVQTRAWRSSCGCDSRGGTARAARRDLVDRE